MFACLVVAVAVSAGGRGHDLSDHDEPVDEPELPDRKLSEAGAGGGGAVGGLIGSGDCACPCEVERDGRCPSSDAEKASPEFCYKPVCEPGYYRCCSTCSTSVCANKLPMVRSRRNLFECLPCMPGDYCPGCDTRMPCQEGSINPEPKMAEMQDCIPCDFTEQENIERTVCCEVGRMECINPPKGKNFGFVSSLLVPAVFMLS
jgi:hypothetical protein